MRTTYTEGPYKSFTANVPANLVGKEGYAVQLRTDGQIELYTNGKPIGVLMNRLEGTNDWNVHLFGGGGTMRMVSSGAITAPNYVKLASGGTVIAANSTDAAVGMAIFPLAIASGDIVEVIDNPIATP